MPPAPPETLSLYRWRHLARNAFTVLYCREYRRNQRLPFTKRFPAKSCRGVTGMLYQTVVRTTWQPAQTSRLEPITPGANSKLPYTRSDYEANTRSEYAKRIRKLALSPYGQSLLSRNSSQVFREQRRGSRAASRSRFFVCFQIHSQAAHVYIMVLGSAQILFSHLFSSPLQQNQEMLDKAKAPRNNPRCICLALDPRRYYTHQSVYMQGLLSY